MTSLRFFTGGGFGGGFGGGAPFFFFFASYSAIASSPTFSSGSHVFSASGYPSHFTRYMITPPSTLRPLSASTFHTSSPR